MMGNPFQDQLLRAGLVDKKKVKKVSNEVRQQKKKQRQGKEVADDVDKQAAEKARIEKQERDRQLNQKIKDDAEQVALAAQVSQMIQQFKLNRQKAENEYKFTVDNKIKSVLVTPDMSKELARGRLSIVHYKSSFEVIPTPVAHKIAERDTDTIVPIANSDTADISDDGDDYYAQFEIPEDLDW